MTKFTREGRFFSIKGKPAFALHRPGDSVLSPTEMDRLSVRIGDMLDGWTPVSIKELEEPKEEAWDGKAIYRAVKSQSGSLRSRVSELGTLEGKLEADCTTLDASFAHIKNTIEEVLSIPADAHELETMADGVWAKVQEARKDLVRVKKELYLVREANKYMDKAYDALHWAGFAEGALEKFDKEQAEKPTPET